MVSLISEDINVKLWYVYRSNAFICYHTCSYVPQVKGWTSIVSLFSTRHHVHNHWYLYLFVNYFVFQNMT